jgi:hypothetical protein
MQFDPTSLTRYGHLALVARNLVEGFLTGMHKSPYKGFSVEFAEHRQYYPGDEIRHIDWRAFGKTDRYYIKEYEEETNLKAHLLVDASGSMGYRGKHTSKFQYAQYVAASLAYLMLHQRDAVGLALHDTQVRQLIKPRATSKHLLLVLQALEQARPCRTASRTRPPCCAPCSTCGTGGTRSCCSTSSPRKKSSSPSRSGRGSATWKPLATGCWSIPTVSVRSICKTSRDFVENCATPPERRRPTTT